MPTFIGASGGGGNSQIADAVKNLIQQTSPLNLAHASLYGANADKARAEAQAAQQEADALRLIAADGRFDPTNPAHLGALVVAKRSADALALNRARAAQMFGATDPRTDAATVGAGGSYTTTAGGQRIEIAGQGARQDSINATSRANNADTIAGEMARKQAQIEADRKLKEYELNNSPQNVMVPDGRGGMVPAVRNKVDAVNPATGAQPILSVDQAIGGTMQTDPNFTPPAPPAPTGVLQGGAVPSQIPAAPSFMGQPTDPTAPMNAPPQTVQYPLAHDLTNTVTIPPPPQPPSIVNPPLTPPPSMTGGQSRVSSVIDNLDPRVRNMKGLTYPPRLTFIDPATNETGVSEDGGRSIIVNGRVIPNDGRFKQAGPETGVSETRNAVAKQGIQPFDAANPQASQIFQSVRKPGVGGAAGFVQEDVNRLLGSTGLAAFLPGGQFGADQEAARQRMQIFNNQMTKALLGARSAEAGVKEQGKIASILPSAGFFVNPETEAGKIVQLYGQLMEQNRILVDRLRRPEAVGAPFEKLRAMLDENETALKMVTDPQWATKYTGETVPGAAGGPAQPAGDAVEIRDRNPAPTGGSGGFKILGVRDK